jgi:hypothetical protein
MNRREALLISGSLLVGGCYSNKPTTTRENTRERCPCVDPDENPRIPLDRNHVRICAFHITPLPKNIGFLDNFKREAFYRQTLQLEVWHYCTPVSDGVFQCTLYDGAGPTAKLIGIEYVIVEDIYNCLPPEEKELWHPHDYEIMNGLLTIHDVPGSCEEKLLKVLLKSYGKSWHTWPDPTTKIPMGNPLLMWSATGDNQIRQELINHKETKLGINTEDIRQQRHKILGEK